MKNLIWLFMFAMLAIAPVAAVADHNIDESVVASDELTNEAFDEEVTLENENGDAWRAKHLGCVNSASSCRKRAYNHGYSHSKIQQDYLCPKTIYSCYAW